MQPILKQAISLRVLLTPLLWLTRHSILYTVVVLTLLDIVDCNPVVLSLFPPGQTRQCSLDRGYELVDKVVDWTQNAVALGLLSVTVPLSAAVQRLAWVFILYRALGVSLFAITGQDALYVVFFEFIKEFLLLVWWFDGKMPSKFSLMVVIFIKIVYEYLMHGEHVMLKLYRKLFL